MRDRKTAGTRIKGTYQPPPLTPVEVKKPKGA